MSARTDEDRRRALIIAASAYVDPTLQRLRAPGHDAADLAAVLHDPAIGAFDIETLIDPSSERVMRGVASFCATAAPSDLMLVYLSCHGVLDDRGRLYYAMVNTERPLLAATAVSAQWLSEQLDDCRSRRQILVLDCCHSGAFAKGAKGEGDLALKDRFAGRGKVVLTASRSTEYSFEGAEVLGEGVRSVFTRAFVDGLRTGDADRDKDGRVTVTDLYRYVYDTVQVLEPRQTPELWTYGAEGDLLVALSPRGAIVEPAVLPEDLLVTLQSPRMRVRESGVRELAELIDHGDAAVVLSARQALARVGEEDHPRIAALARAAGNAETGTAVDRLEAVARSADADEAPVVAPAGSGPDPVPEHRHIPDRDAAGERIDAGVGREQVVEPRRRMNRRLILIVAGALIVVAGAVVAVIAFTGSGPTHIVTHVLTGHAGPVTAVAMTPDGKQIVSGSIDGTVRVWDLATGRTVHVLDVTAGDVWSVAVTPDGKRVISGSDDGIVQVWDLATGRRVATTCCDLGGTVRAVAVTPDGRYVISGSTDGAVWIWDLTTDSVQKDRAPDKVLGLAVTPDGTQIVLGLANRTVEVRPLADFGSVHVLRGHEYLVNSVAVTPDGRKVVSGSNDATVRIWDLSSYGQLRKLEGHRAGVRAVAVTPDGGEVVSGSNDATIRIWNIESGELSRTIDTPDKVIAVAVTPDGRHIISGSEDASLRIWDLS
jgi:WD40 repeat protein